MATTPLTDVLARLTETAVDEAAAVETALTRVVTEAHRAYPAIKLEADVFVRHLAKHLPRGVAVGTALSGLDLAALFLCCACAQGDASAIAELERAHLGKARAALRRIRGSESVAGEVEQRLRELLFLPGKQGAEPKIAKYGGRGELSGWLRTVAMRTAFEVVDPGREVATSDEALAQRQAGGADPEGALIQAQYGARLKAALEEALGAIGRESRRDLRRYYFEGLGVEVLAQRDGVAVSTISRRLARARELLLRKLREILERDFGAGARELDSMLRAARTQLELTREALGRTASLS